MTPSYRVHRGHPENDGPDVDPGKGFAGGRFGHWLFILLAYVIIVLAAVVASLEWLTRPMRPRRTPLRPM